VDLLRSYLDELEPETSCQPKIIAKFERPQAVMRAQEILNASDGLMVARGDLGVELGNTRVPSVQKELLNLANVSGKVAITATQMLESMIEHNQPTRAEVSDVANAVYDGSDAVMLSGETSVGNFPVHAVNAMAETCYEAEKDLHKWHLPRRQKLASLADTIGGREGAKSRRYALAESAMISASAIRAKAIVAISQSGEMARHISSFKSRKPILALTSHERVYHQMNMFFGVIPILIPYLKSERELLKHLERIMSESEVMDPMIGRLVGNPSTSIPTPFEVTHSIRKGDVIVCVVGESHISVLQNTVKMIKV
jgi:pyruvate kinase